MMLMAKINLLEETATATCTGSGTYVYSRRVPAGEVWRVRAICVSQISDAFSLGHLGIYNGATYRILASQLYVTDYEGEPNKFGSQDWTGDIYVKQGDMIYAHVEGETESATLTLEVYGEILKEE